MTRIARLGGFVSVQGFVVISLAAPAAEPGQSSTNTSSAGFGSADLSTNQPTARRPEGLGGVFRRIRRRT